MAQILKFSDIDSFLKEYPESKYGGLLDTNLLIAGSDWSYEFDEDVDFILDKMVDYSIPIYCNVNVRAEFLEIARRVLITEGLLSIYACSEQYKLHPALKVELGKVRAKQKKSEENETFYMMNDGQIKRFRKLFERYYGSNLPWTKFCSEFLTGSIKKEWDFLVDRIGLNFVEVRESDVSEEITSKVTWEELIKVIEKSGAASSDAMILNLLNGSRFTFLLTTDEDIAFNANLLGLNKTIFLPHKHSYWR